MTAHGFRAMASTLLNEADKWSPDAIELVLAHTHAGREIPSAARKRSVVDRVWRMRERLTLGHSRHFRRLQRMTASSKSGPSGGCLCDVAQCAEHCINASILHI
jgi:hypothetical protein